MDKDDKSELDSGFASDFSEVSFGLRPVLADGTKVVASATISFNKNLLKLKLGPERYEKLMKARLHGTKAPKRFITPKFSAGTYQQVPLANVPGSGELAYLADHLPSGNQEFVHQAKTDILPSLDQHGPADAGRYDPEFQERDYNNDRFLSGHFPKKKQHHTFNDSSHLAVDLSVEPVIKDRGSDYNGMARKMYTPAYLLGQSLKKFFRQAAYFPRWVIYRATGSFYLTGPFLSLLSRMRSTVGHQLSLIQRFGLRAVVRRSLIARGWLTPKRQEVSWPAAEALKQPDGSYLASGQNLNQYPNVSLLQQTIDKAAELGVDILAAVRLFMALRLNLQELEIMLGRVEIGWIDPSKSELPTHIKNYFYPTDKSKSVNELHLFIVNLIVASGPVPEPVAPRPEHDPLKFIQDATATLFRSCKFCHGTNKVYSREESRYVECMKHEPDQDELTWADKIRARARTQKP